MNKILQINNLDYYYQDGQNTRTIFNNLNYGFEKGKFYSIVGESGSGKTTLLILLAGLDEPKKGQILFNGENIKEIGYDNYHRRNVQIIFQNYNLLNYLNAYDNVLTTISISDPKRKISKEMLDEYLNTFGIDKTKANRKVNKLSGGEQQRVAIARAIACNGEIILADEPTGNLDKETEKEILDIFKKLAHEENKCIIIVTHSKEVCEMVDEVYELKKVK